MNSGSTVQQTSNLIQRRWHLICSFRICTHKAVSHNQAHPDVMGGKVLQKGVTSRPQPQVTSTFHRCEEFISAHKVGVHKKPVLKIKIWAWDVIWCRLKPLLQSTFEHRCTTALGNSCHFSKSSVFKLLKTLGPQSCKKASKARAADNQHSEGTVTAWDGAQYCPWASRQPVEITALPGSPAHPESPSHAAGSPSLKASLRCFPNFLQLKRFTHEWSTKYRLPKVWISVWTTVSMAYSV